MDTKRRKTSIALCKVQKSLLESEKKTERVGRVYLITNKVNGKRYVGFTIHTIQRRWAMHLSEAKRRRSNMVLYDAIRKYGPENFQIQQIYSGSAKDALKMEPVFIRKYRTICKGGLGYNITYGGGGALGLHHSIASRRKMSAVQKGRVVSAVGRMNISLSKRGRTLSDVHKAKISVGLKRFYRSEAAEAVRRNVSLIHKGSHQSEETKRKMRLAWCTRAPMTEETKRKMRLAWNARRIRGDSDETHRRRVVSAVAAWVERKRSHLRQTIR